MNLLEFGNRPNKAKRKALRSKGLYFIDFMKYIWSLTAKEQYLQVNRPCNSFRVQYFQFTEYTVPSV